MAGDKRHSKEAQLQIAADSKWFVFVVGVSEAFEMGLKSASSSYPFLGL